MATACSTGQHGTHDVFNSDCPCRELLDLIANKWSALVIGALEPGPMRFGELRSRLSGVSSKVLTATLRRLEEAALIDRAVFAEVPPRVEYSLTDLGHSAAVPLAALRTWAEGALDRSVAAR